MKLKINKLVVKILTVATLVFSSCEKEEIQQSNFQNEIQFQKISLKEIRENTEKSKSFSHVLQVIDEFKKKNSTKRGDVNLDNYYVDENNGSFIESDGKQTYTFPVYDLTTENQNIENLVITVTLDGMTQSAIVKYALTAEDLQTHLTPEQVTPVDITGKVMENNSICMILFCDNSGHATAGASHIAGEGCYNTNFLFYVYVYIGGTGTAGTGNSGSSAGGTVTTPTPLPGTGSTGNGTSGTVTTGTGTSSGGIITTPVAGTLSQKQLNFLRELGLSGNEFMQLSYTATGPVINYINTATNSQINAVLYFFKNQVNYLMMIEQSQQTQAYSLQYLIRNNFSSASITMLNQLVNQSTTEANHYILPDSVQSDLSLQLTLSLLANNTNFGSETSNAILQSQLVNHNPNFGMAGVMMAYNSLVMQETALILSTKYPANHQFTTWEFMSAVLEAQSEIMHLMFDVAGMAPVVGPIFDATNGVWYAFSGDFTNSGLSFTAMVPFVGDWTTVARISKRVYVYSSTGAKVILKSYKLANGVLVFSNRGQLRKILGITNSLIHAHHIIPYSLTNNKIVQMAAKFASDTKKAWHPNDITNGIAIPSDFHLNGHAAYLARIEADLAELSRQAGDNYELAWDLLTNYTKNVKDLIAANPNLSLGEIALLIPRP